MRLDVIENLRDDAQEGHHACLIVPATVP